MAPTEDSRDDDRRLMRYVLGLLPDEETERLDETCIVDDEVASRLRIVENDLVDSYVRGQLTGEMLERFESYYLSSPLRRERVRFAASFVHAVDRAAARAIGTKGTSAPTSATGRDKGRPVSRVHSHERTGRARPVWKLAAVAAFLLVVSGWLLFDTVRLRDRLNVAQRESAALERRARDFEQQLNSELDASAAATAKLTRARASVSSASSSTAAGLVREGGAAQRPEAIALVLLPQTRAVASIPTLAVPPGADRVTFGLRLESNDFPQYQIGLKDPATNQIVWRGGWVQAQPSGDQPSISVVIPASVLKAQHYSLDLTGRGAAGSTEVVGSYAFRILSR